MPAIINSLTNEKDTRIVPGEFYIWTLSRREIIKVECISVSRGGRQGTGVHIYFYRYEEVNDEGRLVPIDGKLCEGRMDVVNTLYNAPMYQDKYGNLRIRPSYKQGRYN